MGTEELFTCQAPELALSTWLASLRLAEEDGHLLTRLVPLQCHPHPRGELLCKGREDPKVLAPDLCHLPAALGPLALALQFRFRGPVSEASQK